MVLRLQMIVGTDKKLPIVGGGLLTSSESNEFLVSTFLNLRFSSAFESSYGFTERSIVTEEVSGTSITKIAQLAKRQLLMPGKLLKSMSRFNECRFFLLL